MTQQFDVVVIGGGPGGILLRSVLRNWAFQWPVSTTGKMLRTNPVWGVLA